MTSLITTTTTITTIITIATTIAMVFPTTRPNHYALFILVQIDTSFINYYFFCGMPKFNGLIMLIIYFSLLSFHCKKRIIYFHLQK